MKGFKMRYREMGKTKQKASVLGFGAMRLPMLGSRGGSDAFDPNIPIDETEAGKMVEYALDQGINYFDTAYGYHGGKSETFLGKALRQNRSKVMIATKLPTWLVQKPEDFEKFFQEQLGKLGTDYIDFYLVHGLGSDTWAKMRNMGILDFLERLKASGRIRYAGFSFHDELKVFKEIVSGFDWSMCMVQYNFYDQVYQAGKEGLEYAASRDLGIVVMEPLRGGKLVASIPPEIQALWDSAANKKSPAEWGLQWVWNHSEVSTVLTGASSLNQLAENIGAAHEARAGSLSAEELSLINQVRDAYRKLLKVDCTGCGYCMPCPNGVNIPHNFTLYNDTFLFKDPNFNVFFYNEIVNPEQRASNCNECLECEELCPQKIKIAEALKDVHKHLYREKPAT
jgi:predicted aldo/keto reductase-like oxidoreductase